MTDPSKRFITLVLALGIIVLIAGIALGEREGDRVMGQVTEKRLQNLAPVTATPAAEQKGASPYGPDWKRTNVMAAATDPGFPDPRVPPVPLPTAQPTPKYHPPSPAPSATPTTDLNIPIWRRGSPLPTATATPTGSPLPQSSATTSASPQP